MERLAFIQRRLKESVEHFRYMKDRYNLNFCLLLFYAPNITFLEDFVKQIRKSDKIIDIDKEHFAMFFYLLSLKDYEKVIDKLVGVLMEHNISDFHIGIACSDERCDGEIITRAYQNLKEAIDYDKEIVDEF